MSLFFVLCLFFRSRLTTVIPISSDVIPRSPFTPSAITQIAPDPSAWTLVAHRKPRPSLSVPVVIPTESLHLPRTSKTALPYSLDFNLYEEPEEPWIWPSPLPKSLPLQRPPVDLSWYTPNPTSTPTSSLTQDIPWQLEPEPVPEDPQCTFSEALAKYP